MSREPWVFIRIQKTLPTTHARIPFFARHWEEIIKFLKHCPNGFIKIQQSHSTPKGPTRSKMESKLFFWDLRNIARICSKTTERQGVRNLFFNNSIRSDSFTPHAVLVQNQLL